MEPLRGEGGQVSDLIVLLPVFNDWAVVTQLLPQLDDVLHGEGVRSEVLLIDDASTETPSASLAQGPFASFDRVTVLTLRRNVGHQRAICVGLVHIFNEGGQKPILVMDGDGQDSPEDVPKLLDRFRSHRGTHVVFASRSKRAEGPLFAVSYMLFVAFHYLLTGIKVRVGNFSVLPALALGRLVAAAETWNHYSASVFRSRLFWDMVTIPRAKRISGKSHMNYVALVTHGLSAISVFADIVGVRLLIASTGLIAMSLLTAAGVFAIRLGTDWAIPGWATYVSGLVLLTLLQSLALCFLFVFITLYSRSQITFLPLRDAPYLIAAVERFYPDNE